MSNRGQGFTLIELMAMIAIVAILVTLAVPSFRQFIKSNRATTQTNSLLRAFKTARSAAITRNTTITVRPAEVQPNGAVTNKNQWNKGWIVFVDQGVAGKYDAGDTLLHVFPKLSGNNTVHTALTSISYQGNGLSTASGTLALCDGNNDLLQGITIDAAGSARASNTDMDGNAIGC